MSNLTSLGDLAWPAKTGTRLTLLPLRSRKEIFLHLSWPSATHDQLAQSILGAKTGQGPFARQVAQCGSCPRSYPPLLPVHTSWDQSLDKAIPELKPGFVCELAQAKSVPGPVLTTWWSGRPQDSQCSGPAWSTHRNSQDWHLLLFPYSSRGGRAGCSLSMHCGWTRTTTPWGRRRLEAVRFCLTGRTTSLIGSPAESHQPDAGTSSAMGSGCSPGKDGGSFGPWSQLKICPGFRPGLQWTCWRLSWLNVGDGRSVQMHSLECVFSDKGGEWCPHGSGNFK